jgi:CO dehydrogenase nickel-insertion accessory protein CooC1
VLNKITDESQVDVIKSQLTVPVLATINYEPSVQDADLQNKAVFEAGGAIVGNLRDAKDRLKELIKGN